MPPLLYNPCVFQKQIHPMVRAIWEQHQDSPWDVSAWAHLEQLFFVFQQEFFPSFIPERLCYQEAYGEILEHEQLVSRFPNFSGSPYSDFHDWFFDQAELAAQTLETHYFLRLALKMYRCKTVQSRALTERFPRPE